MEKLIPQKIQKKEKVYIAAEDTSTLHTEVFH